MTLNMNREAVRARQDEALRLREQGLNYSQIAVACGYVENGRVYASAARNAVIAAVARRQKMAGTTRRFGVEIETVGLTRDALATAISAVVGYHVPVFDYHGRRCACCGREYTAQERLTVWKVERDGSLVFRGSSHLTGEVVSPILTSYDELNAVVTALYNAGARPNRSTGLHVHVECSDLSGQEVARVVEFYTANQDRIDQMVSVSRRNSRWAGKYRNYETESMKQAASTNGKDGLRGYANKYRTVNLTPLFSYGTLEFRQHQGTTNAKKIVSWVKFVQSVVAAAQIAVEIDTSVELGGMLDVLCEKQILDSTTATYLKQAPTRLSRN